MSDDAGTTHPEAVGPYRVISLIGEGGMGLVYRAVGPDGAPVAVKLVKGNLARDAAFKKRFDREARMAASIQHPHVVSVVDTGEHEGVPFIVQRFVEGWSLEEKLQADGPLDPATTVRVCTEIIAALGAIHAVGVVHRDLKPGNVLLDEQGSVHITDFGLAKQADASMLTMPGQVLGSMDYMAPEQIRGAEVTAATDLYALGCVAYVCISGQAPFADRQGMKILWAHLQDAPPDLLAQRPDLPPGLVAVVMQALAKEPQDRPSSEDFARRLQESIS